MCSFFNITRTKRQHLFFVEAASLFRSLMRPTPPHGHASGSPVAGRVGIPRFFPDGPRSPLRPRPRPLRLWQDTARKHFYDPLQVSSDRRLLFGSLIFRLLSDNSRVTHKKKTLRSMCESPDDTQRATRGNFVLYQHVTGSITRVGFTAFDG